MDSVQSRAQTRTEHHHEQNNTNKKKKLHDSEQQQQHPSSVPSASTSPAHEFSFTISLHSSSNPRDGLPSSGQFPAAKTPNNSFAIDLSPADDIFFHGHLLPLHLLSHLPPSATSPRSSTNSLDSFTLPIKDLILDEPARNPSYEQESRPRPTASSKSDSKIAHKSKSFSLFGMPRWRKVMSEVRGRRDRAPNNTDMATSHGKTTKKQGKRNVVLDDVSQLLKRYIRMVRPLLFTKRNNRDVDERRADDDLDLDSGTQHHGSYSGNLSARRTDKNDFHVMNGRRASDLFFSAPASMRTSPTNSGLLVPTPTAAARANNDSSTMDELQAAIQAAIAHCKNSIAASEEGKAIKA